MVTRLLPLHDLSWQLPSSICLLQAKPVFADVDINSGNITAESIEKVITKKTKAISVVHFCWMASKYERNKIISI